MLMPEFQKVRIDSVRHASANELASLQSTIRRHRKTWNDLICIPNLPGRWLASGLRTFGDEIMRKVIVQEFMTLDGVMQAPGAPEEDTSNDFRYGGWTAPYFHEADEDADALMQRWLKPTDLLLGRKTFEIFAAYWPTHADMWPGIMDVTKYCVSTTMTASDWKNSVFLNCVEDIKSLRNSEGSEIHVIGSGNLVQTLFKHDSGR